MATAHKLVEFFSTFVVVPIDPDDVVEQIKSYGVKDEIEFVWVSLDIRVIRGALRHYVKREKPYSDPIVCADIFIDKDQPREWKRLVAVKELLHLLDHSVSRTSTAEDCERLLNDLTALIDPSMGYDPISLQAWADHLMLYYAIAVLFPEDFRELILEDFKAGRIILDDIQGLVDLPLEVVALVMSDGWSTVAQQLAGRK